MMSRTAGRDLAEALEPDVGHAVARADRRKAADEIGLEADLLDEPRAERVVRAGHHQEPLVLHGLVDDLAKACLALSGSWIVDMVRGPSPPQFNLSTPNKTSAT